MKEWNIILLVWGRALLEVGLTHGAVLEYTVGKGRDLEVFRALEKGCRGGAYVGGWAGGSEGGVCLLV